ncbi:MAG: hypothetical protein MJ096_03425 [Clostridia bacterium]|nr:hypothetical protein [Clostridia bacterium]
MKKTKFGEYLLTFLFVLFWNIGSLFVSLPVWALLILHFTIGLHIKWFWIAVGAWFAVCLIRYFLILFARSASTPTPRRDNKNPYSAKNEDFFKK